MNDPGRRKGKPNKGGGKRGRGGSRGGRGRLSKLPRGGGSRKGSNKAWDDGDDICFSNEPQTSFRPSFGSRRGGRCRRNPETSTPLQTIHMTSENQERVKELLRELQGQELEAAADREVGLGGEEEFDELDYLDNEDHYWSSHADVPFVMEKTSAESPEHVVPEAEISPFAIGKLSRYGFEKERCLSVLKVCDCDVGISLEHLLQQCFSETYGEKMKSLGRTANVPMEECMERRQEEAFALSSICGDKFVERIPNRVWTIGLELEYLTNKLSKTHKRDNVKEIPRDICRFYLQGSCRFGLRCKFKHDIPKEAQNLKDDSHLRPNKDVSFFYELEIRFPEGNKYPCQAPLIAFHSINENLPLACRLHIAEFLYGKALMAAETCEPVVYALLACLEDEEEIFKLLDKTHHKYSVPALCLVSSASTSRSAAATGKPAAPEKSFSSTRLPEVQKKLEPEEESEDDGDEVDSEAVMVENKSYANLKKKLSRKYSWQPKAFYIENAKICKHFRSNQSSRSYQEMLEERRKLPAWQKRETILDLLSRHQVLVVSGMTGCGKTTQIPQFILDASLKLPPDQVSNIICTQPRRMSAISVAERVAKERAERLGLTVGYQIRLESVQSSATRLLYCTTGILLKRLEGDTFLQGVTHVIVDEVHERTEESDFLLLVLKDVMVQRPDLCIVLMSATLNAELFSQYFKSAPVVNIPGRMFPVDQFFLEDAIAVTGYVLEDGSPYARSAQQSIRETTGGSARGRSYQDMLEDLEEEMRSSLHFQDNKDVKDSIPDQQLNFRQLMARYKGFNKSVIKTMTVMDMVKINLELIEALLEWIVKGNHSYPPGAVLVFLPGMAEIKMLYEQLQSNALFSNRCAKRCIIYPLHSSLSSEEQQAVFQKAASGVIKIILSTNIAETSITIDDIVYVIDSGKMREKRYDPRKGMESLEDTWVSRANALQRKGRAGRVTSGVCFHLFTSHHYQKQLVEQQLPEIQRVPLEQLCLRIKMLEMFAEKRLEWVLSQLIEPPRAESLQASKLRLHDLGALTPDEKLTPLGYHLASLPVDVRIGKLMLFGAIFRCLDPALTIAASLAFKSPFVCPWEKREEANSKKLEFAVANSDHLALLQAYKGWSLAAKEGPRAGYNYCRENFLSGRVLQEIASLKRQFTELLSDIGFVKEGLRARDIEKRWSYREDGVLHATGEEANSNAANIKLIASVLCAALYPNIVQVKVPEWKYHQTSTGAVKMQPKAEELRFVTKNDGYVHIHPSSVNFQVRHFESPYLVYHEKMKTSRVFVRDCSMVSVYPLVLFSGGQVNIELNKGKFVVSLDSGWIRFVAASHQKLQLSLKRSK
ncbi:putative ATP-dependent RNA helicase DHX57 isoform X3 [Rhinatrema bivittatum]|uniref:putative ATP-dependent RNA helicase DHX57 isoform X3 n=1 Tax=Rhinatrema bivittatum TaxID=194408 RepID=UPI00112C097C|nr:putative ATP-dependent RNA helicase DHX57 isoform X3 [Rhinatrema bivittatum]